jgi:hypothetical protein
MDWKQRLDIIAPVVTMISAGVAVVIATLAFRTYRRNATLERSRWASSLYDKFYKEDTLKRMRDQLDCPKDSEQVSEIVVREESAFTDYLNFFEFIAFLKNSNQLTDSEIDALFGYYLDCLTRHDKVSQYIHNATNGYEGLVKLLDTRK